MNRRPPPSRLAVASRRMQVRIKQENAASAPQPAASPGAVAAGSLIDLDLLVAIGRARLRVAIDNEAQRHSQEIARESAALQARFHACLNRRNDSARLILKKFRDENFWRWLHPFNANEGSAL